MGPVQDLWMTCPDGIRLATRLWRPDPAGRHGPGPWPVLLMRQPYGRAIASTVTYAHPSWYAERGFLVAVQDVRGRGNSEGEFRGFAAEAADGAAAVRWARSLDGANGRVGTYGFSYQGLTQLLNADPTGPQRQGAGGAADPAAGEADPLPDCLAPAMAGLDERLHWASEGGAHWWGPALGWALQLAAEGCRRRGDHNGWWQIRRCLEDGSALERGAALLEQVDPSGMGAGWLRRDPAEPEGWSCHGVQPQLWRRPMLLIGGWHDPQLRGVLDLWQRGRQAGGAPGLVIGSWTHLDWRGGIDALQLAFFERHLRDGGSRPAPAIAPSAVAGGAAGLPAPAAGASIPAIHPALAGALRGGIAVQLRGSDDWCNPAEAELTRGEVQGAATPTRWTLRSDGRAAIDREEGRLELLQHHAIAGNPPERAGEVPPGPDGDPAVCLVHDPWRPVPARGGHLGSPAGEVERGDLDQRADVACFSSAPLGQALRLLGRASLEITLHADQPGFDLAVALSLLPAGGDAVRQLSTGFRRVLGPQAQQSHRWRVELQPLAVSLAAGDRLRLSIAAAAWPAFAVNPGDGSLPWGPAGPDHRVITLVLSTQGSLLQLEPLLS